MFNNFSNYNKCDWIKLINCNTEAFRLSFNNLHYTIKIICHRLKMKRYKCYPGKYWPKENWYNITSNRQNIFLRILLPSSHHITATPSTIAKEAEVQQFYEDRQDLLELTTKKDVLFITGDSNAKLGSQEISGITGKFGLGVQNEAGQRLAEFFQGNALVIANTFFQQHKRRLDTWRSPDGQYRNQIDYILCSWRWRSSIKSAKTRPGADCGSDCELFIAKFRLKLKKVGKTTRPFRYDLNQIPYDYTVELTDSRN